MVGHLTSAKTLYCGHFALVIATGVPAMLSASRRARISSITASRSTSSVRARAEDAYIEDLAILGEEALVDRVAVDPSREELRKKPVIPRQIVGMGDFVIPTLQQLFAAEARSRQRALLTSTNRPSCVVYLIPIAV